MKKIFKISKYKSNIINILIIIVIILLGLLSRKISIIPYFVGDMLRGMMIFFIILLFINKNLLYISIIAIFICFSIEFSQLLEYDWLINIRNTQIGGIILGRGFLLSDLIACSFGIYLSYFSSNYTHYHKKKIFTHK